MEQDMDKEQARKIVRNGHRKMEHMCAMSMGRNGRGRDDFDKLNGFWCIDREDMITETFDFMSNLDWERNQY